MNPLVEAVRARARAAWQEAMRAGRPVTGVIIDGRLIVGEDAYWQALARMDERQAVRAAYGDDHPAWVDLGGGGGGD